MHFASAILKFLSTNNLDIQNLRGQGYDASTASLTTKFKKWHAQGTKKAKGFLSKISCCTPLFFSFIFEPLFMIF